MKIKNIAFFGVMAAILSVGSAARADSTTVIASQAYVDAKDALKQNLLNSASGGNIVEDGTGNVVTSVTANGQGTVTIHKGNVDVSGSITTALDALDLTNPSGNGVITEVSQSNGQVSATRGLVGTNAISDGAITTDKIANSNVTMGKTNFVAVQGTYEKGWNDESVATDNDTTNRSSLGKIKDEELMDQYVPTVLAVEKRVQEAESAASGNYANKDMSNLSNTGKDNIAEVGTYNGSTNYTAGTIGAAIKTLNSDNTTAGSVAKSVKDAIDALSNNTATGSGTVVKGVTQANGKITADMGKIADADVDDNAAIASTKISFTATEIAALGSGITSSLVTQIGTNQTNIATINSKIEQALSAEGLAAYNEWVEAGRKQTGTEWTNLQNALRTDVDNVVADYQKEHQDLIPRNRNIQKGIAYLKGTGIENYTIGVKNDDTADVGIKNGTVKEAAETAWTAELNGHGDEFVPTVASVERRVQAAERSAGNSLTSAKDNTASASVTGTDSTLTIVTAGNDGNQTTKLATSHAVAEGFTAVNTAIGNMTDTQATTETASANAVTAVSEANGKVTVTKGKLTAAALDSSAVSTSIGTGGANGTATNDKLATELAVANAIDSVNTDVSGKANKATNLTASSANSIVQYNNEGIVISGTAAGALATKDTITYSSDTDFKLSNVDVTGQADTAYTKCTKNSPCTLTFMYDSGRPIYEWTNMDTENTDALL